MTGIADIMSHLVVKNTFLDLEESQSEAGTPGQAVRKCKSAAAVMRRQPLSDEEDFEEDTTVRRFLAPLPNEVSEEKSPVRLLQAPPNLPRSQLVVKNTFLDIEESQSEAETPGQAVRKCKSAGAAFQRRPLSDEEDSDEGTPARFFSDPLPNNKFQEKAPAEFLSAPLPNLLGSHVVSSQKPARLFEDGETMAGICAREGACMTASADEAKCTPAPCAAQLAVASQIAASSPIAPEASAHREDQDFLKPCVKNTFLNFSGTESLTPVRRQRKSKTVGFLLPAILWEPEEEAEETEDEEPKANAKEPEPRVSPACVFPADPTSAPDMDVYCATLIAQIEAGGDALAAALAAMRPYVLSLAFDRAGCRVVQLALEKAKTQDAVEISAAFHGHVHKAILSPHANHVIQKIIQQVPSSSLRFIAEEIAGEAAITVRHHYGCRIFCRLAEFDAQGEGTLALLSEILSSDVVRLCNHDYGHHVVNQIMESGPRHLRTRVVHALAAEGNIVRCAKQRNASQVIERGLQHGFQEERDLLAALLLANPVTFGSLACHVYGVHVARALLLLPAGPLAYRAQACLYRAAACSRTRKDRYGQQLLREMGLLA